MDNVRAVDFFDCNIFEKSDVFHNLYFSCSCSGAGFLVFGTPHGTAHILDRSLSESRIIQCFDSSVTHLNIINSDPPLLLAVGDDGPGTPEFIRFFRISYNMETGRIAPYRELRIFSQRFPPPLRLPLQRTFLPPESPHVMTSVSAVGASSDLTLLGIGLSNGDVVIFRGPYLQDRNLKPRIDVRGTDATPITLIHPHRGVLWASTAEILFRYAPGPPGSDRTERLFPGRPGLIVAVPDLSHTTHHTSDTPRLIAAAPGVLRIFPSGSRPLDIDPLTASFMFVLGDTLGLVFPPGTSGASTIAMYSLAFPQTLRVFRKDIPGRVTTVVCEWGRAFVLSATPSGLECYVITQRDSSTNLQTLLGFGMFDLARALVSLPGFGPDAAVEVTRREALHLFEQGNYDLAIECFLRPGAAPPPSDVIRKFLAEPQALPHLPEYLIRLHQRQGQAHPEHTRLLLRVLAKQHRPDIIAQFLLDARAITKRSYNPEAAVAVCRAARFYDVALATADAHGLGLEAVRILVRDLCSYADAVQYIRTLPLAMAEDALAEHGHVLMEHVPDACTLVLMHAATQWVAAPRTRAPARLPSGLALPELAPFTDTGTRSQPVNLSPSRFIPLFGSHQRHLMRYLECVLDNNRSSLAEDPETLKHFHTLLAQLYIAKTLDPTPDPDGPSELLSKPLAQPGPPEQRAALPAPTSRDGVEIPPPPSAGPTAAACIRVGRDSQADQQERWSKALLLLQNPDVPLDEDACLVAAYDAGFREGVLALLTRKGLYEHVIQMHIDAQDPIRVLDAAKRLAPRDSFVWLRVLTFLVESPSATETDVAEALAHLKVHNALPPGDVVRILGMNTKVSIETAADYLYHVLTRELCAIEELTALHENLTATYDDLRVRTREARATVQVIHTDRCSHCGDTLSLPAIHFLCRHSFHAGCLKDVSQCPACRDRREVTRQLLKQAEEVQQRARRVGVLGGDDAEQYDDPFQAFTGPSSHRPITTEFLASGGLDMGPASDSLDEIMADLENLPV